MIDRREFDRMRAELAALHREMRRRRRWSAVLPGALVALLVALVPGTMIANDRFSDVPPQAQYSHHDDINLVAHAGITVGCGGDPTVYCPNDFVTRGQMATFLARTAGLGDYPPIADARTAQIASTVPDGAITPAKLAIPTGTVIGHLAEGRSDAPAQPLVGVTVYASGTAASATTDAAGRFVLAGVPLGIWALDVHYSRTLPVPDPHGPGRMGQFECQGIIPGVRLTEGGQVMELAGYRQPAATCAEVLPR